MDTSFLITALGSLLGALLLAIAVILTLAVARNNRRLLRVAGALAVLATMTAVPWIMIVWT